SDGGGSIRIPAGYGGTFGLKSSRGRISSGPQHDEGWLGASVNGVIARSVRDSEAMLDVLAGAEPGDPFRIPAPEPSFAEAISHAPGPLRIGYFTESPLGTLVHPECIKAAEETAKKLEALGHHVEPASTGVDGLALAKCYLHMYLGEVAWEIDYAKRHLNARGRDFELDTRMLGMLGRSL
ncbi:MAG TPA: amidase, partial [Cytophagales bacterium]|nr:amidase [Cytophagales bacterium]